MRFISKAVTVVATVALTAGGLAATTTSASSAEGSGDGSGDRAGKRFNFVSSAYGTRVFNKNGNLVDSGRTAWSFLACTTKAGVTKKDHLAAVELPGKQLKIGGVTTNAKTRKIKGGVKSVATTRVGDISLRAAPGLRLKIDGLKGVSTTSYKNGRFRQKGDVNLLGIKAVVAGQEINLPINPDNISAGQTIKIPGLARLRFLRTGGKVMQDEARNNSVALEIKVLAGGPLKGQTVRVGSARTRLEGVAKKGMLRGFGQAARADLLDGVVSTGRIGHRPMPCVGTDGKWKRNSVASVNVPGLPVRIGAASGQVRGQLQPGKAPMSHTRARIAGIRLSDLRIGAVQSWAKVTKKGKKYRKVSGARVLNVRAGGRNWTKAINRAINQQKSIRIPGIATITPNVVKKNPKSVRVTALRIRLLDVAKPLRSTIHLATSSARIK